MQLSWLKSVLIKLATIHEKHDFTPESGNVDTYENYNWLLWLSSYRLTNCT